MKLPEKIKGYHKIRDAKILMMWGVDHEDTATIAAKFGLKERRILQILRANHKALPVDKEWEKKKRIERLQRWIKKKPETFKDAMDVQEELRKEIEGTGEAGTSRETKVVIIRESNANQDQSGQLPRQISVLRV